MIIKIFQDIPRFEVIEIYRLSQSISTFVIFDFLTKFHAYFFKFTNFLLA